MTAWRFSWSRDRESILRTGFEPRVPPNNYNQPAGVYLWLDKADAIDYFAGHDAMAVAFEFDHLGRADFWEVDATGLPLYPDELLRDHPTSPWRSAHYTPEPVGPERLTLLT
jgi:hypothetical protein